MNVYATLRHSSEDTHTQVVCLDSLVPSCEWDLQLCLQDACFHCVVLSCEFYVPVMRMSKSSSNSSKEPPS